MMQASDFKRTAPGCLLAAMVVEPRLSSLLLFDASYAQLEDAASTLVRLLKSVDRPARCSFLARYHQEDTLWGTGSDLPRPWRRFGLLTPEPSDAWTVLVIPDLSALALTVARACVQLVDASWAYLERRGQKKHWRPRLYWIAQCSRREVGQVSPHLLDRFLLRYTFPRMEAPERLPRMRAFLTRDSSRASETLGSIDMQERLQAGAAAMPTRLSDAELERVVSRLATPPASGLRRHLTLARLAQALAALDGATVVGGRHVEDAAQLLGIEPPTFESEAELTAEEDELPEDFAVSDIDAPKAFGVRDHQVEAGSHDSLRSVVEVPEQRAEPTVMVSLSGYPEDGASAERDHASLQLPLVRSAGHARSQGVPIGVCKARGLEDLALAATLFAAAPFQPIRRRHLGRDPHSRALILSADDLRAWRRAPPAGEILALLLEGEATSGA